MSSSNGRVIVVGKHRPEIVRFELAENLLVNFDAADPISSSAAAMIAVDDGTGTWYGNPDLPITVHSPSGGQYGFAAGTFARGSVGYAAWNPRTQTYQIVWLSHHVMAGVLESGQVVSLYRRDATAYLVDSGVDVTIPDKLAARYTWLRDGQFVAGDKVIAGFDEQSRLWYLLSGPVARP